jgi:SAM-dependent methyltransferase
LIKEILKYSKKPEIYEPGNSIMWTDKHISEQLLQIHLNKDIDLASRRRTTIDTTLDWILNQTGRKQMAVLDLGCGPGLYAEILAGKGHKVTAVDFSQNSISYAKSEAAKKNLDIQYVQKNYLELDYENQFDLVILIYTDFGVLLPEERDRLLSNIYKSLKPGGVFIFDVLNDKDLNKKAAPKNWELTDRGFWKNKPYLALSDSFIYPENNVILYQHIILDENGSNDVYRFWTHFFNNKNLSDILEIHGFRNIGLHDDVLPGDDLWSGNNVTFCAALK